MSNYRPSIPNSQSLPSDVAAEMRVSHAGEVGAVALYKGLMTTARDIQLQQFARKHIRCEERHLSFFDTHVDRADKTKLMPLWQLSGFGLGAALGLMGKKPTMAAVEAIETFVEGHYRRQVKALDQHPDLTVLASQLGRFADEEGQHRRDAESSEKSLDPLQRVGQLALNLGSRIAVKLTKLG